MRVQPLLPSMPFETSRIFSEGSLQNACSAAIRPAPPVPRIRISALILSLTRQTPCRQFGGTDQTPPGASDARSNASARCRADRHRDNSPAYDSATRPPRPQPDASVPDDVYHADRPPGSTPGAAPWARDNEDSDSPRCSLNSRRRNRRIAVADPALSLRGWLPE